MQFTTTTTLIALTSLLTSQTALAAPAPQTTIPPSPPTLTYSVTNFQFGCSPGGCVYNFDVSAPAADGFGPAFTNVHCSGTDVQNKFVACSEADILANVVPGEQVATSVVQMERLYQITPDETDLIYGNGTTPQVGGGVPEPWSFDVVVRVYGQIAQ